MALARISVSWQNWPGAPGVSQFYGDGPTMTSLVDAIRTFFEAIKGFIPQGLAITVPASGDLIDESTGKITGSWSQTSTPAVVTGTGVGNYAGNAGFVVHWLSTTVVDGRRLRGRTFIVPAISSAFDATGSLAISSLPTIQAAAAALVTSAGAQMQVWHRPLYAKPKTVPPTLIRPGSKASVTSSRVPDLAVSLRSRRI